MAFLEVIVRTFGQRPNMLKRNLSSLENLHASEWTRMVVVDDKRRGVNWANRNLATIEAFGDYVWVLDDDDLCCRPTLLSELQTVVSRETLAPDVIMLRAYHAVYGMMPSDANWQREPVCGNVGWSCFVVRREVWNAHRHRIAEEYASDWRFIHDLWLEPGLRWYWHDHTAAYYPQQSIGAAE